MRWYDYPLEWRASMSVLLGCVTTWPLLGLGVDGLARAVAAGLVAGLASSLAGGRLAPGWALFAAGCSFVASSGQHPVALEAGWIYALTWMLVTLGAWQVGGLLVSLLIPHLQEESPGTAWSALQPARPGRSLLGLAQVALLTAAWLLGLFPGSALLALPFTFAVTVLAARSFPFDEPGWPAAGGLLGMVLAYLAPQQLQPWIGLSHRYPIPTTAVYPFDLGHLPPPDPWLLGGLILMGSVSGFWFQQWLPRGAAS